MVRSTLLCHGKISTGACRPLGRSIALPLVQWMSRVASPGRVQVASASFTAGTASTAAAAVCMAEATELAPSVVRSSNRRAATDTRPAVAITLRALVVALSSISSMSLISAPPSPPKALSCPAHLVMKAFVRQCIDNLELPARDAMLHVNPPNRAMASLIPGRGIVACDFPKSRDRTVWSGVEGAAR